MPSPSRAVSPCCDVCIVQRCHENGRSWTPTVAKRPLWSSPGCVCLLFLSHRRSRRRTQSEVYRSFVASSYLRTGTAGYDIGLCLDRSAFTDRVKSVLSRSLHAPPDQPTPESQLPSISPPGCRATNLNETLDFTPAQADELTALPVPPSLIGWLHSLTLPQVVFHPQDDSLKSDVVPFKAAVAVPSSTVEPLSEATLSGPRRPRASQAMQRYRCLSLIISCGALTARRRRLVVLPDR